MGERLQSPMAMWRLQFHLIGGMRRLMGTMIVYAVLLVVGAYGFRRFNLDDTLNVVAGQMLNALAAIQIFILILGGCNAVFRANMRDYESKMVESHRLTPMSNNSVVLGYMFGATLQMSALFLVGLAFGAVLTAMANLPVSSWIGGNFFILNGAMTLWAASLVAGLRLAKPISPAGFIIGASVFGNAGILILPAAGVIFCGYPVVLGFQIITGSNSLSFSILMMIAALTLVMTTFWISTGAAKYRRPDLPALHAVRGLILLAFWVITGTAGIVIYFSSLVGGQVATKDDEIMIIQWIGTLGLSLLVAIPAIAGSVECRQLIARGTLARSWVDRVPTWATCLCAALVIIGASGLIGSSIGAELIEAGTEVEFDDASSSQATITTALRHAWGLTVIVVLLALFTVKEVHATAFATLNKPRIIAAILLVIFWAAPPIVDTIRDQISSFDDPYASLQLTGLFGCSPIGSLIAIWVPEFEIPVLPGLIAQACFLCLLAYLSMQLTRKKAVVAV